MSDYCKTIVDSRYWAFTKPSSMELAPAVYRNWLAYLGGKQCHGTDEYAVLTDTHISGELNMRDPNHIMGPYEVINLVHDCSDTSTQIRLVVRVGRYLYPNAIRRDSDDLNPYELCCMEGAEDEFISLLSLCLGIPLQSGGATRRFITGEQPEGRPVAFDIHSLPERPHGSYSLRMIPSSVITANLNNTVQPFAAFPNLSPSNAASLTRSARLYRDALWYSDSMPDMAWLMLSNAAEAFAKVCYPGIGPTKRFLDFLSSPPLCPAPSCRPSSKKFQILWEPEYIRECMKHTYGFRCDATHEGKTLPSELKRPPIPSDGDRTPPEYPPPYEGKPKAVHMHIFAHIVRGAILQWWTNAGKQPSLAKGLSEI